MIGIILAPELGIAIAMHQYLGAREGLKRLRVEKPREIELRDVGSKDVGSKDIGSKHQKSKGLASQPDQVKVLGVGRDEITKAHIFLANMGGFIVKICVLPRARQESTSLDEPDGIYLIPKTSLELIYMIRDHSDLGK